MPSDVTTIPVTKDTRDRLKALGRKGETYDQLINRLIDAHEGGAKAGASAAGQQGGGYARFEKVD